MRQSGMPLEATLASPDFDSALWTLAQGFLSLYRPRSGKGASEENQSGRIYSCAAPLELHDGSPEAGVHSDLWVPERRGLEGWTTPEAITAESRAAPMRA